MQVLLVGAAPPHRRAGSSAPFSWMLPRHPNRGISHGLKLPWKQWSYIGHPVPSQGSCLGLRSQSPWCRNSSGCRAGGDSHRGADMGREVLRVGGTGHQGSENSSPPAPRNKPLVPQTQTTHSQAFLLSKRETSGASRPRRSGSSAPAADALLHPFAPPPQFSTGHFQLKKALPRTLGCQLPRRTRGRGTPFSKGKVPRGLFLVRHQRS